MEKGILLKYGEIVLKGNNRLQFENALLKNIRNWLRGLPGTDNARSGFEVRKEQGRFFVSLPSGLSEEERDHWMDQAVSRLKTVFGIVDICPVDVLHDTSVEALGTAVVEYVRREYSEPHTFKVFCKRTDKTYPMNSMELASEMGGWILDHCPGWKVDVHDPQEKIFLELRSSVYVYGHEIKGLGGLPLYTGGKAALLLSGGIDSPVAGWMMARRGVNLTAVYFHAHPYTSDQARDKVLTLAQKMSVYTGPIPVYVVPFTEIEMDIYTKCHPEKLTIIMRRMMMRIAEKIARIEGANALVTGENVGQVASQTLDSMYCVNAVCQMPVYRPVVAFDKQEIIDIARKIDTFETSILPYEDCCTIFVAKHPVTHPKLEDIEENEQNLAGIEAKIDQAVQESDLYLCKPWEIKKVSRD